MKSLIAAISLAVGYGLTMSSAAKASDTDQSWVFRSFERTTVTTERSTEPRSSRRTARTATTSPVSTTTTAPASRRARAETVVASSDIFNERPQRRTSATAVQSRRAQAPAFADRSLSGGERGVASYYWQPQRVAAGGWFNPEAMTAAHKTLPFGTRVRVTRSDNGQSVEVTINDRGPYIAGRIIDLSRRAAQDIGMTGRGIVPVTVTILGRS